MIKLSPEQYSIVSPLFHADYPNVAFAYSVIENLAPGEIWVNTPINPSTCLIITNFSYCFVGGMLTKNIFLELFELIKFKEMVKLVYEPQNNLDLSEFGFTVCERRQYSYKNQDTKIPIFKNNSQYLIKRIDSLETFNQCLWNELITSNYGTGENFLKNGIGFIFWDEEKQKIASESYGIVTSKFIEIGTVTAEDYRKQKLSTMLCNHLLRYAVSKGKRPFWCCDEVNVPSWKVAERQGMDNLLNYKFHVWSKSETI